MARALTTPEKAYQRRPGQWSKFYLSGCIGSTPYSVIYSATLTTPLPTSDDDVVQISFTGGVGTLANVLPDMLLYVGSTAGAYDLGFCRIRKAPIAGTFYIAEVSDVDWLTVNPIYLTVVDDYMLTAKQIFQSGSDFYMDVDVAYVDQNSVPDPTPRMGSHRVALVHGLVTALNPVTLHLGPESGYPSFVIDGSTIASVTWSAVGPAAVTFSNTHAANPTATITVPGKYVFYLLATATNGKTFTGVRYAFIHDDSTPPISSISKLSWEVDYQTGGWAADVTLRSNFDVTTIRDRAMVVIFSEDFANIGGVTGVQYTPAAPIVGAENIVLAGWIQDESIIQHPESNEITFRIQGAHYWFGQCAGFVVGIELNNAPSSWIHIPGLTVDKGLWHLLHWRSTADRIMDIALSNDTRYAEAFKTSGQTLWQQLNEIAGPADQQPTIGARPGVDFYGRFFSEIDPQLIPVANRTWPIVTDILEQDMDGAQEPFNWKRNKLATTSLLNLNGVAFDSGASPSSFFSNSPGHVYKRLGQPKVSDNWLAFPAQADNNALAGLFVGWDNNNFPDFEPLVPSYIRALDCFPRQYVNLVIPPSRDPRGEGYSGNAIIRSIKIEADPKTGAVKTNFVLEAETFPELATDGDAPNVDNPGMPPLPPLPVPPPLPVGLVPGLTQNVIILVSGRGIFYTKNFNTTDIMGPTWFAMNGGLSNPAGVNNIEVSATGRLYCQIGTSEIWYASRVGATWKKIFDTTMVPPDPEGLPFPRSPFVMAFGINRDADDELLVVCGLIVDIFSQAVMYSMYGSSGGLSLSSSIHWNADTTGTGLSAGHITMGNGVNVIFWGTQGGTQFAVLSRNGASASAQGNVQPTIGKPAVNMRGKEAFDTLLALSLDPVKISQDNGNTYTALGGLPGAYVGAYELAISNPNGMLLLIGTGSGLYKSSDGGATVALTAMLAAIPSVWNLATDNDWIVTNLGQIWYTPDFTGSFQNKTGNLQTWIPGTSIIAAIRNY